MAGTSLNRLLDKLRFAIESQRWEKVTDAELLECFLSTKNATAFEAIVRRHANGVLGACRRVLGQPADVDDVFQATFLVLIRQARTIRRQQSLGSFLFGVAHRLALRTRARAARRSRVESQQANRMEQQPTDLSWRESCAILHEELDRLPDAYRMPLMLCYLEGKTRDEAAADLCCSVGTLHGRLERGRERLRSRLHKRGIALSAGLLSAVATSATAGDVSPALIQSTLGSVFAGPIPPQIAALVQGLKPMFLSKLQGLVAIAAVTVGLVAVGIAISEAQPKSAPPKQTESQKSEPSAKAQTAPAEGDKPLTEVSGRVLGPDGKPVASAKLFVPYLKKIPPASEEDVGIKQIGTTDADGNFRLKIPTEKEFPRGFVFATTDETGMDAFEYDISKLNHEGITLNLVRDLPITGRIVDTEGKPLPGVQVRIGGVYVPADDKLDAFLESWKKNWRDPLSSVNKRIFYSINKKLLGQLEDQSVATTDKDGRFRLAGAGAERIVLVNVEGGNAPKTAFLVITREKFDPKPYNEVANARTPPELRIKENLLQLYGPDFTLVAGEGKVIEGTVKDLATGKPLPSVRLSAYVGYNNSVTAVSDANGKYRLAGLPLEKSYHIRAGAPTGAYVQRTINVEAGPAAEPIRADIELANGVIVSGRVIDRETGKGVRGGIRFAPLADNTYSSKVGFDGYKTDHTMNGIDAAADGRFRIVTIPGKSLLMFQVFGSMIIDGKHSSPYMTAVPDPGYKDQFKSDRDDGWIFTAHGNSSEFLRTLNVVKVVDLKEGSDEIQVELFVERGRTAKIAIQDADGKPLSGVVVSGVTEQWPIAFRLSDSTATIYALDPSKPRQLRLLHSEKQLGGVATIRGDEKEPVVVKLAALGSVTARFVNVEGKPIVGADISISAPDTITRELYRHQEPTTKPTKTDSEGRFTLSGIVPGCKISLQIVTQDKKNLVAEPKIGFLEINPGQTLDLGERILKPRE